MQKKRTALLISVILTIISNAGFAQLKLNAPLFGVAYYDEYMPYERLDKDVKMMQETGCCYCCWPMRMRPAHRCYRA